MTVIPLYVSQKGYALFINTLNHHTYLKNKFLCYCHCQLSSLCLFSNKQSKIKGVNVNKRWNKINSNSFLFQEIYHYIPNFNNAIPYPQRNTYKITTTEYRQLQLYLLLICTLYTWKEYIISRNLKKSSSQLPIWILLGEKPHKNNNKYNDVFLDIFQHKPISTYFKIN